MKNFSIALLFPLTFLTISTQAQSFSQQKQPKRIDQFFGVHLGANYSRISGLKSTLLSEPFFIGYKDFENFRKGFTGGLFYSYRFNNEETNKPTRIGLRHEFNYSQQGGDYMMNNEQQNFRYRIQFKYQYIMFNTLLKIFPVNNEESFFYGLNLSAGPQVGLNIAPVNIVYKSENSRPQFGPDPDQQQQLRNVLKGKTNFGFIGGLGYDLKKLPFVIDIRVYTGLPDIISTEANSYNFIETDNTNLSLQFTIGYRFNTD